MNKPRSFLITGKPSTGIGPAAARFGRLCQELIGFPRGYKLWIDTVFFRTKPHGPRSGFRDPDRKTTPESAIESATPTASLSRVRASFVADTRRRLTAPDGKPN